MVVVACCISFKNNLSVFLCFGVVFVLNLDLN